MCDCGDMYVWFLVSVGAVIILAIIVCAVIGMCRSRT